MPAPIPFDDSIALALIEDKATLEGPLLPILHALQDRFGYVDARAIPLIASALNITRAEVFGTITFYHDFKRQKPEGAAIKLCLAEACQARGADKLARHVEKSLGVKVDGGARAGVAVETAYCLGNCALGPNALLDGEIYGRLDEEGLDVLCARAAKLAGAEQ